MEEKARIIVLLTAIAVAAYFITAAGCGGSPSATPAANAPNLPVEVGVHVSLGGSLTGRQSLAALSAADPNAVTAVALTVDGAPAVAMVKTTNTRVWNATVSLQLGSHTFSGSATDSTSAVLFSGSVTVTLTGTAPTVNLVLNDVVNPQSITAPSVTSFSAGSTSVGSGSTDTFTAAVTLASSTDAHSFQWSDACGTNGSVHGTFAPTSGLTTTWTAPTGTNLSCVITFQASDTTNRTSISVSLTVTVGATASTGVSASLNNAPQFLLVDSSSTDDGTNVTTLLDEQSQDPDGESNTVVWSSNCGATITVTSTTSVACTGSSCFPNGGPVVQVEAKGVAPKTAPCTYTATATDTQGASSTASIVIPAAP